MIEHFITYCENCRRVINQCRCPSPNKTVHYELCNSCAQKIAADVALGEGGISIENSEKGVVNEKKRVRSVI